MSYDRHQCRGKPTGYPTCVECQDWSAVYKLTKGQLEPALADRFSKAVIQKNYQEGLALLLDETDPLRLLNLKRSIDIYASCSLTQGCLDLTNFVYDYLSSEDRTRLLQHFHKYQLPDSMAVTHILTDVDDTIYPSALGGSDLSFPDKTFYPGVVQLFHELSGSPYITLLSARPKLLEPQTRNKFSNLCIPVNLLAGGLKTLVREGLPSLYKLAQGQYDSLRDYQQFAREKIDNFKKYASVYPDYRFIFFGDIGQGDLLVAKSLAEEDSVIVSMIHDVYRTNSEGELESLFWQRFLHEQDHLIINEAYDTGKVQFFSNYADAAVMLHQQKILKGEKGLRRIMFALEHDINEKRELVSQEVAEELDLSFQALVQEIYH
jgi:hypothetical protein